MKFKIIFHLNCESSKYIAKLFPSVYVLKRVSFGSKDCTKELKLVCAFSWARLARFCHLGVISDPLIGSMFHNETHDPKGQENKIYTIVKGMEKFYRRHPAPVTSNQGSTISAHRKTNTCLYNLVPNRIKYCPTKRSAHHIHFDKTMHDMF